MFSMDSQHTIARSTALSDCGLFGGQPVNLTFRPAGENHGIVFSRTDLGGAQVPALIQHVLKQPRRTSLQVGDAIVDTCEHCLSALAAMRIDNVLVELDAQEIPGLDGSAKPFLDALETVGIRENNAPRQILTVREPVVVRENGATLAALPSDSPHMHVLFELDYGPTRPLLHQVKSFDTSNGDFASQIAPARTFLLEQEAQALQEAGIGLHLTTSDVLVIGDDGPMGDNTFRFENEPVCHKILDLIGDLYLIGAPIQGRIIANRSSHALNHKLVRALRKQQESHQRRDLAARPCVLDIRKLKRIMPHRYPMLLVDRILQVEGNTSIRGVKNVTINEPFFEGHYPSTPIMPGVLIVEAMAQLSGVLIGQSMEHTGKLPVMMSLDRVRLRRPVTPGDQLVMEAEAVRVRSRSAHMRCRAYVTDNLVAEAEVKFMLVDDEQD